MVTVLAPPVNTNRLRTSKSLKKSGIPVGLWFTMTKEHSCLSVLWKQWQYYRLQQDRQALRRILNTVIKKRTTSMHNKKLTACTIDIITFPRSWNDSPNMGYITEFGIDIDIVTRRTGSIVGRIVIALS